MKSVESLLQAILREHGIEPVLVDVGASGGSPEIWRPIASQSTYVGFDPDLREIRRDTTGGYRTGLIINKALTADPRAEAVTFYLTHSPYCSSMLPPDAQALAKYSFWELFAVDRTTSVPATTLMKVLAEQSLAQVDWLKVDSQGADLRIYLSLDEPVRHRVLAVDAEPGLIDGYRGEDLFVDVHRQLKAEGFWLSNLNLMGVPRLSKAALQALNIRTSAGLPVLPSGALRTSPGWCEARYLRTTEWLAAQRCGEREFILAWTFAMLDRQHGHALDLAAAARTALNNPALAAELWKNAAAFLQPTEAGQPAAQLPSLPYRIARKLGRVGRRILGS